MRPVFLKYSALLFLLGSVLPLKADDIDIFTSGLGDAASAPNILVVFDNTSNWAKQSQQWPSRKVCPDLTTFIEDADLRPADYDYGSEDCPEIEEQQGQAEAAALKEALTIISELEFSGQGFNLGIMEFTTQGNANEDGGYIRAHISQYVDVGSDASDHRRLIDAALSQIHAEVNEPIEKRNSNTAYGNLMYDIYNYLKGQDQSFAGEGTPKGSEYTYTPEGDATPASYPYADPDGYVAGSDYATFKSPLDVGDVCAETYVIFVSNPNQSGPDTDSATNSNELNDLYGGAAPAALAGLGSGQGLQMPQYIEVADKDLEYISVGTSSACYKNTKKCNESINGSDIEGVDPKACPVGGTCQCTAKADSCGGNSGNKYEVGIPNNSIVRADGLFLDGADFNMDDWTKFLYEQGVKLTAVDEDGEYEVAAKVRTFTIDVYNALPNATHSSLMASAAESGGGYRLQAGNYNKLKEDFIAIFSDILAVNTSFAAVSLPLSATNRTQAENKVFIGMFRPAQDRLPRWHGNLKRYQLARSSSGGVFLADVNLNEAINPLTGFADSCAETFWTEATTDETNGSDTSYFSNLNSFNPVPLGECASSDESPYSDLPDGPFVEKGGVAQQIRLKQHYDTGGDPRRLFNLDGTAVGGGLDCSATLDVDQQVSCYLMGQIPGMLQGGLEAESMPSTGLAATVHGDVVHSTPLAITYGNDANGSVIRLFYGANDGVYRAVDPSTGKEDWGLVSSEQTDQVLRLFENKPKVKFSNDDAGTGDAAKEPKPYFLDGNTGFYTEYNTANQLTTGYIYPTMRRGGRMVYALDISPDTGITPPSEPEVMWEKGCKPDAISGDMVCDTGFTAMGQTWSSPVITKVRGWPNPVLLMGGGWHPCLDADDASLSASCTATSTTYGNAVFALDAVTGSLIKSWSTEYPVVASIGVADLIGDDGVAEVAYALDAGGSVYRLSFVTAVGDALSGAANSDDWTFTEIAKTSTSDSLRFFNTPAVAPIPNGGKNYVILAFGSGDREKPLATNYPFDDGISYKFYSVIDRVFAWDVPNDSDDDGGALALTSPDRLIDLDKLAPNPGTKTYGMFQVTESSTLAYPDSMLNYDGWVFTLSAPGEQIVNPAAISGGQVFFNSYNPKPETDAAACVAALGVAKGYRVPLFYPEYDSGREIDAPGLPIPPIIATVQLDEDASCVGESCKPEEAEPTTVTVCIGCEGFNPLEVIPLPDSGIKETYRAENIDVQ